MDLAAEWAGFTTVGQCEWADYPTKVLEKHWPDVPRWRDIRTLTGESFFEKTGLRTVDVLSGGFPCQPFSFAGKREGKGDDRYLWPEMLRVIREIAPAWVLGENVPGIINLALDTVLSDLENEGYATQAFVIPACGVDAPHKRERVSIIGCKSVRTVETKYNWGRRRTDNVENADIFGCGEQRILSKQPWRTESIWNGEVMANSESWGQQLKQQGRREAWGSCGGSWWATEPGVGRVVNGVPYRVDRIKCLGNAVVPHQFYPFFKAIEEQLE